MRGSQLFAPSVLGLGEAETPITADKRLCYALPKLPSATSFIRRTLGAMHFERNKNMERENA